MKKQRLRLDLKRTNNQWTIHHPANDRNGSLKSIVFKSIVFKPEFKSDVLNSRKYLTTLLICLLASTMFWNSTRADTRWDARLSGAARSYPYGGGLSAQLGYGYLIWGSGPSESEVNPWYGYARLGGVASSAGTYNAWQGHADFFPISILGLRAGFEQARNDKDYQDFDCEFYRCRGDFSSTFVQTQAAAGYASVFAAVRARREWLETKTPRSRDFIEVASGLPAQREGDRLDSLTGVLGYKWSPELSLMLIENYSEMHNLRGFSRTHLLGASWRWEQFEFSGGAGLFSSQILADGGTAFVRAQWNAMPAIGLF